MVNVVENINLLYNKEMMINWLVIKWLIIAFVCIIVLASIVIMFVNKEFFTSSQFTLPNGQKVYACNEKYIPDKWPYKDTYIDTPIDTLKLRRESGTYGENWDAHVDSGYTLNTNVDQILWFAGLVPNYKYILKFNDYHLNMKSDENGRIFPGESIPLPVCILKEVDIMLGILPGGTPPVSKPPAVWSGSTPLNLNCSKEYSNGIYIVYGRIPNEIQKEIANKDIYISLNSDPVTNYKIHDGVITRILE
jgi:hypothetical protein